MAPVTLCTVGDISLFPRSTFIPRKDIQLRNYNISGKYSRLTSYSPRILIPQSSLGLFQFYRSSCGSKHGSRIRIVSAVGTDVTVEEPNPAVLGEGTDEALESPSSSVETSETTPANASIITTPIRNKRLRPLRKSDMPPVKDEELVQGATFTGKVRSIQPFGAFIDIGAYTEGLVHVSRMSDGYVKDVNDLVSVGQEVEVRIVDVNKESGRISLSMRVSDDSSRPQQRKDPSASGSSDKSRPPRKNAVRSNQKRDDFQKNSKFVKGQALDGTVKNQNRAGAFVSLPDGEEGFLPVSEESEGFDSLLGNSSLQVGQEINVRVLRFSRGKLTLTMKKEEDAERFNKEFNQGVVHVATNPFELAFRRNKDIASFLEVREKAQKASEDLIGEKVIETIPESDTVNADGSTASAVEDKVKNYAASAIVLEDEEIRSLQKNPDAVLESSPEVEQIPSSLGSDEVSMPDDSKSISGASAPTEIVEEQVDRSKSFISEETESTSSGKDEPSLTHGDEKEDKDIKAVEENEKAQVSESLVIDQLSITEEFKATEVTTREQDESSSIILGTEDIGPSGKSTEVGDSSTVEETNSGSQSLSEIEDQVLYLKDVVSGEVTSSQPDDKLANEAALSETLLPVENEKAPDHAMDVKAKAPENENGQTGVTEQGSAIKATISPTLVKQLRDETGAGMMDCKKALTETDGDIIKAQEFLRKKGLASADKKASRATAEGRVGSYIHDNRIGVLIEVNCETDFVSRGDIFKGLVDDLAMQVAACPQVRYLTTEDVPKEFVNKEREIEMQKEDLLNKPEQIRSKIVDGRIRKRLEEISLLEQPYIKNDKMVVKDLVKQTIATIGENMKVKRFIRYNLGEGLERKSQDFSAEVAAQTAAKAPPATPKEQTSETVENVEKPPTIAVSAALVKQLREETGAGMMDCKKALTETEGDLEKAQEYLRTKGLSSADKKSSRLAAEGRISSYIHDARIGTLIEVNCETDFVARNEKFKELVDDLAMQVVASPQVEFVSVEEIPQRIVKKEKEIEMQREDLTSKSEHIREKIVEGRISKRLGELALLEQPFIKDDSLLVKDLVKQTIAALGENVRIRRFVRYTLGEDKD